jgi:hypothetical protein
VNAQERLEPAEHEIIAGPTQGDLASFIGFDARSLEVIHSLTKPLERISRKLLT